MKYNEIVKVPFGLAGMTIGFGTLGKAFNSPGLVVAGNTTAAFIPSAIDISVGGSVLKKLKELGK